MTWVGLMYTLNSKWSKLRKDNRLYHVDIPIIGLTGGLATGKTTVSQMLIKDHIPLIDADQLVKEAYSQTDILDILKSNAPEVVNDKDQVNFPVLRKLFFNNPQLRSLLEAAIYAKLPGLFKEKIHQLNDPAFVVYDVPLLFEKDLQMKLDSNILVYAPRDIQFERALQRDKSDADVINKILDNQMDIEQKKSLAEHIVRNLGSLDDLGQQYQILRDKMFHEITT
jgi:dephospho-CoA kinase